MGFFFRLSAAQKNKLVYKQKLNKKKKKKVN